MPDYVVSGDDLALLADSIRSKGGTSAQLAWPDGFIDTVDSLPTGGFTDYTRYFVTHGELSIPTSDLDALISRGSIGVLVCRFSSGAGVALYSPDYSAIVAQSGEFAEKNGFITGSDVVSLYGAVLAP